MARTTQRKRRRRARELSETLASSSESDGGASGSSEDERDECEKQERRWQLRLRRSTTNLDDAKGKGKELVKEDEDDDDNDNDDEDSRSMIASDDSDNEEEEAEAEAAAVAEEEQQQQQQEMLRPAKSVGTPQDEICGICLSEGGNERGKLDCCDHFFCFACIMEWSKVESRCPMCKQRFVTVMRPAVAGVSRSRTRSIRIPTRDQVYEPSEEEIRLFTDPYQNTVCTECQEAGDEGLLLLCDRCDAAAHTYCVGLGRSVPRGDWFCQTCQLLEQESSCEEDEEDTTFDMTDVEEEEESGTDSFLAMLMRDVQPNLFAGRTRRSAAGHGRLPLRRSTRRRVRRSSISGSTPLTEALLEISSTPQRRGGFFTSLTETHPARTLSHQRQVQATVHNRLQNMRQNWDRYQSGEVQFGSEGNSVESSRPGSAAAAGGGSSSTARLGSRYRISTPSSAIAIDADRHNTGAPSTSQTTGRGSGRSAELGDIERAWANMDRARRGIEGSNASASQPVGISRTRSAATDRKREEGVKPQQQGGTPVSARTREKSHQADAMSSRPNSSSRGGPPLGERQSHQIDNHSRGANNSSRGTTRDGGRHLQGDRHYSSRSNINTARGGPDFLTRSLSNSRDPPDSRDSSVVLGLAARRSENGHAEILSCGPESNRSGYHLRESNRQYISKTGNNPKDNSVIVGSSGRSPLYSILDDKDSSRGSGGYCTRSRDAKENQSQHVQSSSILDDKDNNSRGSVGVLTRWREANDAQAVQQGRSILDEKDNSNSRGSIGPSSTRETDRSRSMHSLSWGSRDQSMSRNPSKDEERKLMKEQCYNLVHVVLKPILDKGAIDKNQFKELARSATHTILSSLGVPGLKQGTEVVAVGTITCDHEQPISSSLIPGCCTSCVQRYVKRYVKSLVKERTSLRM